jgi:hypothetical protein
MFKRRAGIHHRSISKEFSVIMDVGYPSFKNYAYINSKKNYAHISIV